MFAFAVIRLSSPFAPKKKIFVLKDTSLLSFRARAEQSQKTNILPIRGIFDVLESRFERRS
jgi:hypothetical protein